MIIVMNDRSERPLIPLYVPDDPGGAIPEILENVLLRDKIRNYVDGLHQV